MSTTLRIALQTLRSILRERVALSMLALLALVWLLLPSSLEGDGTVAGDLRMQIQYTLGFSITLIAGMTVWISCAAIASDLSSKRLHMVLTKPVSRAQVWWGKWLAVTVLISGLVMLSTLATGLRVAHRLQQGDVTDGHKNALLETLITARPAVSPDVEDLTPEAQALLDERREAGMQFPDTLTEKDLLRYAVRQVKSMRYSVQGGSKVAWTFPLSKPVAPGERLQLGVQIDGGSMVIDTVQGTWTFTAPDQEVAFTLPVDHAPHGSHTFILDHQGVLDGATSLTASFALEADTDRSLFFEPDSGIRLFRAGNAFSLNMLRVACLFAGLLSLLAALGLSSGSLFSLPVACYTTSVLLLMQAFSGVIEDVIEASPDQIGAAEGVMGPLLRFRLVVFRGLRVLLQPMDLGHPLERLAGGESIPLRELAETMAFRFAPVLLVIAIPAILLFRRREAGVAS